MENCDVLTSKQNECEETKICVKQLEEQTTSQTTYELQSKLDVGKPLLDTHDVDKKVESGVGCAENIVSLPHKAACSSKISGKVENKICVDAETDNTADVVNIVDDVSCVQVQNSSDNQVENDESSATVCENSVNPTEEVSASRVQHSASEVLNTPEIVGGVPIDVGESKVLSVLEHANEQKIINTNTSEVTFNAKATDVPEIALLVEPLVKSQLASNEEHTKTPKAVDVDTMSGVKVVEAGIASGVKFVATETASTFEIVAKTTINASLVSSKEITSTSTLAVAEMADKKSKPVEVEMANETTAERTSTPKIVAVDMLIDPNPIPAEVASGPDIPDSEMGNAKSEVVSVVPDPAPAKMTSVPKVSTVNGSNHIPTEISNEKSKIQAAEVENRPKVVSNLYVNANGANAAEVAPSKETACDLDGSAVNAPEVVTSAMDVDEDDIVITDEICPDASHLCSTCGQIFATPQSLTVHQKACVCFTDSLLEGAEGRMENLDAGTDQRKNYHCDLCGRYFTFLWGLDEHITAHVRKLKKVKALSCVVPKSKMLTDIDDQLARELLQFSSLGEFMCKKCGRCSTSLEEMTGHVRRHLQPDMLIDIPIHSSAPLDNGKSGKLKKVYTWVAETPEQHRSTFAIRCSYCQEPVGCVRSLVKHVPQCHNLSLLQPQPQTNVVPPSMQKGLSMHLPEEPKPFVCECQQQFQHLWMLQQHLQMHLDHGDMTSVHAAVVMRQNKSAVASSPADGATPSRALKTGTKCSACGQLFSSVGLLKVHKETAHCLTRLTWTECCSTNLTFGGYFQCDECPALVHGSEQFRQHVAGHAEKKLNVFLRCKLQLKKALKYSEPNVMPSHDVIGEPQVARLARPDPAANNCPYCGATFDSRTLCMLHVKRFCQKNPSVPGNLGAESISPISGTDGLSIEEERLQQLAEKVSGGERAGNNTFACKHCEIVCTSLLAYSHHFEQHMKGMQVSVPQMNRVFVCLICSQRLATQAQYNAHMQSHQAQNSVCGGCYRLFHSSYPLQKQANGGKLCLKCAAVVKSRPTFVALGQPSGHTVQALPPQTTATYNYVCVVPSRQPNASVITTKQNTSRASKQKFCGVNQFDGTRIVCRKPDGTFILDEQERAGYESVLQKLGFSLNETKSNSTGNKTTSVIDISDSSNEGSLTTDEPAAAPALSDASDEFMPTDFLSIEMAPNDANEELIFEDAEGGDGVQVSQEHAYASHVVNAPKEPWLLYENPVLTTGHPQTPVLLASKPTSLLSQLLTNSTPLQAYAKTAPLQSSNSRMVHFVNGPAPSQFPVQMQLVQNTRNYDLTNWHVAHLNGAWTFQNSAQKPTHRTTLQKQRSQPRLNSLSPNLPPKYTKSLLKHTKVSPRKMGTCGKLFGIRECSVVLERLNPKILSKVYSQVTRHNVLPSVSKRVLPVKVKMPNVLGAVCSSSSRVKVRRPNNTKSSSNSIFYKKVARQRASSVLSFSRSDSRNSSASHSKDNITGRTSPDCVIIMQKKNGVIVPTLRKPTPSLRKPKPSLPMKQTLVTQTTFASGSGPKRTTPVKPNAVHITPCKVQLEKSGVEASFAKSSRSSAKRLKLEEMPLVMQSTISNDRVTSCSSSGLSIDQLPLTLHPCRVMLQKLDPCLNHASRIHINNFKPLHRKLTDSTCCANSSSDLVTKLTEATTSRTVMPQPIFSNNGRHDSMSNDDCSKSVNHVAHPETAGLGGGSEPMSSISTATIPHSVTEVSSRISLPVTIPQQNMTPVPVSPQSLDCNFDATSPQKALVTSSQKLAPVTSSQKFTSPYKLDDCMVILHRLDDKYLCHSHVNV